MLTYKLSKSPLCKTDKNYCSVIAVAIACDLSYEDAYKACQEQGRVHGKGMKSLDIRRVCEKYVDLHYTQFRSYTNRQFRTFYNNEIEFLNKRIVLVGINEHIVAINNCMIEDFVTRYDQRSLIHYVWVVYPKGQKPEDKNRLIKLKI